MKVHFHMDIESFLKIEKFTPAVYPEPMHLHNCVEIGYCLSGEGSFIFSNKSYTVRPGDVFVVNHLERHMATSNSSNPSTYLFLLFEMANIEKIDPDLTIPFIYHPEQFDNRIVAESPIAQEIGTIMKTIWKEYQEKQTAFSKVMKSLLLVICSLLVRHSKETRPSIQRDRINDKYNVIQKALHFIRNHYHEDIHLKDVAEQLSLSTSRIRHLFYEMIGEGFKTYLLHFRVNEAKRLLIHSDLSITDTYLQCGFQSAASFYRVFKLDTGMSPLEYRERSRSDRVE